MTTTKHLSIYVISTWTIAFLYGVGCAQGSPGCEVEVRVQRGAWYHASPQEPLELKCPVRHCGRPVRIIWCRMVVDICKMLNNSEHIQINETRLLDETLESVLRLERISKEDSGSYLCKEVESGSVGHLIYVRVSDSNEMDPKNVQGPDQYKSDQHNPNNDGDEMKTTSYAFFVIFLILALVLLAVTAIALLREHNKRSLRHQAPKIKAEQLPAQMIPDLPEVGSPSCLSLTHSGAVAPPPLPERTTRGRLQTGSHAPSPRSAVYSEIDHTRARRSIQRSPRGVNEVSVISVVHRSESAEEMEA